MVKPIFMRYSAAALALVSQASFGQPYSPPIESDLKFDDLFPRMPFFGRQAGNLQWSEGDRYLGYVWNAYDTRFPDLWVYDTKSSKSVRVTSPEMFMPFDPQVKKAIERYEREERERDQRNKLGEKEYREELLKIKKEAETNKQPKPEYPGPGDYAWNHKGDELLIVYKGDLYRLKIGDKAPTRLTATRDQEGDVKWMPDDSGFYFRRGEGLYKMLFSGAFIEQLDPKLPDNLPFQSYALSPDGTKMIITSEKSGQYRQIEWTTYKNRFGQTRRDAQALGMPDEKLQEESHVFIYDLSKGNNEDNKPWEIWKWKSEGDELRGMSLSQDPWSPDSKSVTFATYDTLSRDIELHVVDVANQKDDVVHKTNFPGESSSAMQCQPFFTPDGRKVIALFETTGWRLPWMIDLTSRSARALCQGEFEAYPIKASPDGKTLVVSSTALDPARSQIYRVDLASGGMARLTAKTGDYSNPIVSHDTRSMAMGFANWSTPRDMYILRGDDESQLTKSFNPSRFAQVNKIQPELFSFKNRHGQTIHGYRFLPPGWKKGDKRPCWVYTYGGPLGTGNSVQDGAFSSENYLLAMYLSYTLGFVCVTIDPRGSSGYGAAFVRASFGHVGEVQNEDLVDCAKFVQSEFGADPKKMLLSGWSFGGWQTQYTMYHDPDAYTLGIAGAGPTEWQNYNQWYTQETIAIQPEGKVDVLDKFSLTKVAMNLKHPIMILHGMDDDNVLFVHTINVYRVLCQYGLAPLVEMVIDPTGSHGLGGDLNRRDTLAKYVEFIIKHWGASNYPPGK